MKVIKYSKAFLYLCAALLIFIFNNDLMPYIGYVVGGIVAAYAAEELVMILLRKEINKKKNYLFDVIAQLLISVVLFWSSRNIEKVCVIWGVWAILRESKETTEAMNGFKKLPFLSAVEILESTVIIVLSFIMIVEPTVYHARLHSILLGVELVIVVFFSDVEELILNRELKKSGNVSDSDETRLPTL